jgi:hypothetical protein
MYWLLFPKYEFIYNDYDVYSYEWYYPGGYFGVSEGQEIIVTRTSHDGSHCAYEVDNPALHANILHRIPVCTGLIIILLKPDIVWWRNR